VFFGGFLSKKEATFTAYARRDGKITVPKGVRDSLGIKEDDLVECKIRKVKSAEQDKSHAKSKREEGN
jgi:bifunctional DNA-binding transcriptional regulator/antitoxin component of YhaV-PrlF toxin-antitoxin module